jgi:NADP-dependent 3-hydroxy acid dehydrogenase YdfG
LSNPRGGDRLREPWAPATDSGRFCLEARVAPAGFAAYAATKWGINGWSEAPRVELQPDIRVTVIEPGAITTELTDHITDPASRQANKTATAEMGIPAQDIADVIAFAVGRPQRVTLNEILVRPTAQVM